MKNTDGKNHIVLMNINGMFYKVLRLNSKRVAILNGPFRPGTLIRG